MKTLYLDTFAGISGDMFLGLMFNLGVDKKVVCEELEKLNLSGYELTVRLEKRCGIAGSYVDIAIDQDQPSRTWLQIDQLIIASGLTKKDQGLARRIDNHRADRCGANIKGENTIRHRATTPPGS